MSLLSVAASIYLYIYIHIHTHTHTQTHTYIYIYKTYTCFNSLWLAWLQEAAESVVSACLCASSSAGLVNPPRRTVSIDRAGSVMADN